METKTSEALALFKAGKIKEALRIFSTFKIGLTKQDREVLKTAYECLSGKASFYKSIGIDTEQVVKSAELFIQTKYSK
jgi:hypothetical protein